MYSSPIINDVSFYTNSCDPKELEGLFFKPTEPLIPQPGIAGYSVQKVLDPSHSLYLHQDATCQVTFSPQNSLAEFSISHISPTDSELFPELSQDIPDQLLFDFDDKPINYGLTTTKSFDHSRLPHDLSSEKPQTTHKQSTRIKSPDNGNSKKATDEIWKLNNRRRLNKITAQKYRDNRKKHIQAMESKLDLQQVISIKSICRKQLNNFKKFDSIKNYLDRNQKNNYLIKKYGIHDLSYFITNNKKIKIDSADLDSIKLLKRKAKNSQSSIKSKLFKSEYIKKLEFAVDVKSTPTSGAQISN